MSSAARRPPTTRPRLAYLCLQPTVEGQGSHAHVWGIVNGLRGIGWDVAVFQPDHRVTTRGLLARLWAFVAVQRRLRRVVRWGRRDQALYVRMHPVAAPTVRWARRRGIRVVVEVNGPAEDWLLAWPVLRRVRRLLDWLLADQLRRADHVVTVTRGLGDWASGLAGRQLDVAVIPNGVDVDRFRPDATGGPTGLPPRYAAFVGELAPWQGVEVLLAARAHDSWPEDVALVVAGDGVAGPAVRTAAEARPDQVLALGRVPHDQVPGLLAGAAVALVPSRDRRGTGVAPIKLFEALACGVPVVAADVADTNTHPATALVPAADPVAWASSVAAVVAGAAAPGAVTVGVPEGISWAARAADTARLLVPSERPT